MKRGLVLGGGGLVGLGYHAGVLKALDETGLRPAACETIVGTSIGAIVAAYLCSGRTSEDLYVHALGPHPSVEDPDEAMRAQLHRLFTPLYTGRVEWTRRAVGGVFASASSRGMWPFGQPPQSLRRAFPSGLYSTDETRRRLREDLPREWPDRELMISAVELYLGNRVAFGSDEAPPAALADAVLASTAIPGVFPPVRVGEHHYVDGGVFSATSLDLAVRAGCRSIVCIAPLGYRLDGQAQRREPGLWAPMALRAMFARALKREVQDARAQGVKVLVIRPWLTELRAHGTSSMSHHDRRAVVEGAREGALRLLEDNRRHDALLALAAAH